MGYSYEGYYVDPVALREFAAKTAPECGNLQQKRHPRLRREKR